MVVESAPIIPLHEDRGGVPKLALAHRIDERRHPRRTESAAAVDVVGVVADRRIHVKFASRPLRTSVMNFQLGVMTSFLFGPVTDVLYGLIAGPLAAVAVRTCFRRSRRKAP